MPMNHRLLVPQKLPLLLDYAGGAAAAFSLRQLSNSYTGPVVTVRRSTDNAERDFTATEVSDNTLAAWCGGGDGYVKTWHDQSQHGRDATQATTAAQPKIVASGVLVTEGGKAAMQFDGVDDGLSFSGAAMDAPLTIVALIKHSSSALANRYIVARQSSGSNGGVLLRQSSVTETIELQVLDAASPFPTAYVDRLPGEQDILFATFAGNTVSIASRFLPPDEDSSASGFVNAPAFAAAIGKRPDSASSYWDSTISELIIYPTDMTALRTRIEGDLAWYY